MKKNALLFLLLGLQTVIVVAADGIVDGIKDRKLRYCQCIGLIKPGEKVAFDAEGNLFTPRFKVSWDKRLKSPLVTCFGGYDSIPLLSGVNTKPAFHDTGLNPASFQDLMAPRTAFNLLRRDNQKNLALARASSSPKTVAQSSPAGSQGSSPLSLSSRDSSPSSPVGDLSAEGAGRLVGMVARFAPFDFKALQVVGGAPKTPSMAASLPGVSRGGGALSAAFQQGSAAGGYAGLGSRSSESGSDSSCHCC